LAGIDNLDILGGETDVLLKKIEDNQGVVDMEPLIFGLVSDVDT
jgi:hypothetical protein